MYLEPEEDSRFDISVFFNSFREELKNLLEEAIKKKSAIKWHLLLVSLEKISIEGEAEVLTTYFYSVSNAEFTIDNLDDHLEEVYVKRIRNFEKFFQSRSGWILKEMLHFELKMGKRSVKREYFHETS